LKEQAAIDAINSRYSYKQVSFFLGTMHHILTGYDLCPSLSNKRLKEIIAFTHVMLTLIDSPALTIEVRRLREFDFLDADSISDDCDNAFEHLLAAPRIFEHLEWISEIIKKRQLSMVVLLDSYYSKFDYYPKEREY
jgi:hypothetical protein